MNSNKKFLNNNKSILLDILMINNNIKTIIFLKFLEHNKIK